MSMINESDIIKSLIVRLKAVSGASWNLAVNGKTERVYPAGVELDDKELPFLVVGCFDSTNEQIEISDDPDRLEEYLVFIACVADPGTPPDFQYAKYEFAGEVKNSLINSDIDIKDYSVEPATAVYSDILRNIDTTDQVHESISEKLARTTREINGTIGVYQSIS